MNRECIICHKTCVKIVSVKFRQANTPLTFCSDACASKCRSQLGVTVETIWDVNEDNASFIRPAFDLEPDRCTVSKIDGEGRGFRCKKEKSHEGEHDYETPTCGHASPVGNSMLCDRPAGHEGMHENGPKMSSWPTDEQRKRWDEEAKATRQNGGTCANPACVRPDGHEGKCEYIVGFHGGRFEIMPPIGTRAHVYHSEDEHSYCDNCGAPWGLRLTQECKKDEKTFNPIRPDYYHGTVVDDFIEEFELSFRLGSVIKYVARHEHKDKVKDLEKASWYLNREIERLGGNAAYAEKKE